MAEQLSPSSDIFDDFDDATTMETAYCSQVSGDLYYEDMQIETNKALRELSQYLDENPEVYARVLCRRKQEELENAGLFSYIKNKVMRLFYGEKYVNHLVSDSDYKERTSALKSGMCRTFQVSQELRKNSTNHSSRLSARRYTQFSNNRSGFHHPLNSYQWKAEDKPSNKFTTVGIKTSDSGDRRDSVWSDRLQPSISNTFFSPKTKENPPKTFERVSPIVLLNRINVSYKDQYHVMSDSNKNTEQNVEDDISGSTGVVKGSGALRTEVFREQHSTPPDSASSVSSLFSKHVNDGFTRSQIDSDQHSCPRLVSNRASEYAEKRSHTSSNSDQNSSAQSDSASPTDGTFLTIVMPTRLQNRKRSLSNSSVDSQSGHRSLLRALSRRSSPSPVTQENATKVPR